MFTASRINANVYLTPALSNNIFRARSAQKRKTLQVYLIRKVVLNTIVQWPVQTEARRHSKICKLNLDADPYNNGICSSRFGWRCSKHFNIFTSGNRMLTVNQRKSAFIVSGPYVWRYLINNDKNSVKIAKFESGSRTERFQEVKNKKRSSQILWTSLFENRNLFRQHSKLHKSKNYAS